LRLPVRAADFFAARLDRFLAMASLHCCIADVTHRRGKLAEVAA
jgi:hypothetical protein